MPKLHVGGLSAPGGELVIIHVKVTLSALKTFDPFTVTSCVLDCPGVAMLTVAVPVAGVKLRVVPPVTVIKIAGEVDVV